MIYPEKQKIAMLFMQLRGNLISAYSVDKSFITSLPCFIRKIRSIRFMGLIGSIGWDQIGVQVH